MGLCYNNVCSNRITKPNRNQHNSSLFYFSSSCFLCPHLQCWTNHDGLTTSKVSRTSEKVSTRKQKKLDIYFMCCRCAFDWRHSTHTVRYYPLGSAANMFILHIQGYPEVTSSWCKVRSNRAGVLNSSCFHCSDARNEYWASDRDPIFNNPRRLFQVSLDLWV